MTYMSDWREAEEGARRAREANPNCTGETLCPAEDGGHLISCRRFLREHRAGVALMEGGQQDWCCPHHPRPSTVDA